MYKVNNETVTTWNPFVGCLHNCLYCYARQIAKRSQCPRCYNFEPHWHPERLEKPPKFKDGETVFACSMGDVSFGIDINNNFLNASFTQEFHKIIIANLKTTFMLQSKNPKCFEELWKGFPDNLILGTTAETDCATHLISEAPTPLKRLEALQDIDHHRKYITIEPTLYIHNQALFVTSIMNIEPEFIYIGYDNHNHHLNEPTLVETQQLIKDIRSMGIEVREKTIRRAWYEQISYNIS